MNSIRNYFTWPRPIPCIVGCGILTGVAGIVMVARSIQPVAGAALIGLGIFISCGPPGVEPPLARREIIGLVMGAAVSGAAGAMFAIIEPMRNKLLSGLVLGAALLAIKQCFCITHDPLPYNYGTEPEEPV